VDQSLLARQILSGDVAERGAAVEAARALDPHRTGGQLRSAPITALEREARFRQHRQEASWRGEPVTPREEPRLLANLAQVVARLEDPRAIPGLTAALGSDLAIPRALAAFGPEAAPKVLAVGCRCDVFRESSLCS
jgi:hypothetical protein